MTQIPAIHLCIQQPEGDVHALGLLDPARYFRYQFRRLGATVTMAKNRLRYDALNFVFGAHLGFDAAQRERHACIFVNLEQLGAGDAPVSAAYLALLANSAVVDCDGANRCVYSAAASIDDIPVVPLLHAPYLRPAVAVALEVRPIDLLFIGSMNDRRRAWIDRIEAFGLSVARFESPLYGAERDYYISHAKAVVNGHSHDTSRFEQARVAHCLSLGTPVISERTAQTDPHAAFEDSVLWLEGEQLEQFFREDFATPEFFDVARAALARFEAADPVDAYDELLAFATGFRSAHHGRRPTPPWQPTRINLGAGKDYKSGWLNLDVRERTEPDLCLDLTHAMVLPHRALSPSLGPIQLDLASIDLIQAKSVLEHVADLPALMGNCLRLLKVGGEFQIEVRFDPAPTAWQDPTQVRAMHEHSWSHYCERFWHLGWFEHRFQVARLTFLDKQLKDCSRAQAVFMRVVLSKIETTLQERTTARTLQADLQVPDDLVEARHLVHSSVMNVENVTSDASVGGVRAPLIALVV